MATNRFPVVTFNAGELSPLVDARSDVDKFRSGCRILENMIPRIYGPAERRPGTKYIETCNGVARVIPFIYSSTIAYILLLEDQRMYFYYNGGQVNDTWGRRLKVDTPYLAADLFELQYKQSNDVMWITHNDYAQRKLSRTSANAFSLDQITFTNGPFMKRNDLRTADGVTMAPSVTTGSGTLTASSSSFDVGHVGALFSIIQPRVNTTVDGTMTSPNTGVIGSAILVEGAFTFTTHGTWTGTVRLERSIDSGSTWEVYRTWTSENADAQVQYTGQEEEDNVQYRINVTAMSSNTAPYASTPSKIRATLTVNSSTQEGICRVTGYTSPTIVSMTVLKTFASTNADIRWSEGCWSTYRGFPKCVTFFENRCFYAATKYQPTTIWGSATDDFEDFEECTKDDSAFSLTMSSDTRNAIQWIAAADSILVGTTGSEWRIWSEDGPLTPTNFQFKPQTERGSKDMQALVCGDAVLFVDFVGRKVRELTFDGAEKYKYVSPDLTALAEHITKTGITSMAFQRNPDPILWCTLSNGNLISMTYEREQNVIGWAKHPFNRGADVESNGYQTVPGYPTLQVADGTFAARTTAPTLTHTTAISTVEQLQQITKTGNYYLTQDIDASDTVNWNGGTGFKPLCGYADGDEFQGTLDGGGYTITGLYQAPANKVFGLFKAIAANGGSDVVIKDLTLEDCTFIGAVGGPFATYISPQQNEIHSVKFYNCHVTGDSEVQGLDSETIISETGMSANTIEGIGGFVGQVYGRTGYPNYFYDCTTTAYVNADNDVHTANNVGKVGGFVASTTDAVHFNNCRATGNVIAHETDEDSDEIGGFVGEAQSALADQSYTDCSATGTVEGGRYVGGFVGYPGDQTYVRCSAHGNVTATETVSYAGGFSGAMDGGGEAMSCTNCYAWGAVTGESDSTLGSFTASLSGAELILTNCYATGQITGGDEVGFGSRGGLVGSTSGPPTMTNCFWDKETTGETDAVGSDGSGTTAGSYGGHTTEWMMTQSNYDTAGWDFSTVWDMPDPVLWTESGPGPNSVAVIPTSTEDQVWVVVSRVIGGSLVRYLEQVQPRDWGDDQEDCWFVDSGLDYDGAADTTFSGVDHLEGEEVAILADGAIVPRQTVTSGAITLSNAASRVIVGLPYRYKLKPMRFDINTGASTTQTALKNIPEVVVSFYKSGGAKYGKDVDNLFDLDFRTTEALGSPPALYTGDKVLSPEGGFETEDTLIVTSDAPLPCTVRAIVPRIALTGR